MLTTELSNIWSCVSLPSLLASERELFDAHMQLRSNQPEGPDFLGFLGQPEQYTARSVHAVRKAADAIQSMADTLVVLGNCGAVRGARGGIELLMGKDRNLRGGLPRVLFAGDHLSGRSWLHLCELLDGHDFCLHLVCPDKGDPALFIAARSVRWMLERRYGKDAKNHIFISAPAESAMAVMAREEGYTFLSLPSHPGSSQSALTGAALLPMTVCGIDPLTVLEGAADGYHALDLRSFENPAWLYAGARYVLSGKGRTTELLCSAEPALGAFGDWWRWLNLHASCRDGAGILPVFASYPSELGVYDAMLTTGRTSIFETLLRFPPESQKVHVEMDWKDYDGLGYLDDCTVGDVQEAFYDALIQSHDDASTPMIQIACEPVSTYGLGELFYFFELSAALSAAMCGVDPFDFPASLPTQAAMEQALGKPETAE